MNRFLQRLEEQGSTALQLVHNPSAPAELQAIILPEYGLGIVSSAPPATVEETGYTGAQITLNVYDFYDLSIIESRQSVIDALTTQINEQHAQAYRCYKEALLIHDEWEKIYIQSMDVEKANLVALELAEKLVPQAISERTAVTQPIVRFLGAATPEGAVDHVPNLTEGLSKYFIKGRPGSGKSTLLKKLVERGTAFGYTIESYRCGLDPNSLDMVICRELGFAIFDSTAPHEYFPSKATDKVVDMYDLCIAEGTDERFATELQEVASRYKLKMSEGNHALALAKQFQQERAQLTEPALKRDELQHVENLAFANITSVINFIDNVH